ncbi:hypothetical protein [Amycolatopsis sp. RTGN1]|nr:hypothetical protein [Amycolatopsis sp. RTGN1]
MTGYTRWKDVRATHVERAGGEEAVEAGKQELLARRSTSTTATSRPSPE